MKKAVSSSCPKDHSTQKLGSQVKQCARQLDYTHRLIARRDSIEVQVSMRGKPLENPKKQSQFPYKTSYIIQDLSFSFCVGMHRSVLALYKTCVYLARETALFWHVKKLKASPVVAFKQNMKMTSQRRGEKISGVGRLDSRFPV